MVAMHPGKMLCATAAESVADIPRGAVIAIGGFGTLRNYATTVLTALSERTDVGDLQIVSNSFPFEPLAEQGLVSHFIGAFGGSVYRSPRASEEQIRSGAMTFEPAPQGIFTERLRAGAAGLPAFYSPVGLGTVVAEGKERRTFDGREYVLEEALRPDYAIIRAHTADEAGNLTGIGSTQNFHPAMAAAARITIAEVDEVVPAGAIPPEHVTIPGIYVDRVVVHDPALDEAEQQFDQSRQRRRQRSADAERVGLTPELMALRVSQMLQPGQYVNLGVGMPTLIANFIQPGMGITLHAENGFLGYGPAPSEDEYAWYLYNAQGQPVTALPGAAVFDSVQAFTMARGGHVDVVVLGGLQVAANGDLANWWAPYMAAGGMGGAMDLCANVDELIVVMDHVNRDGEPKILNECTYPLTAQRCVTRIVTNLATLDVTSDGLVLRELAPGVTAEYVQERTEPRLHIPDGCREMLSG